jgi:outer membrane protein assembly factor BamE (lipoprotein component of BamABCDE complex)
MVNAPAPSAARKPAARHLAGRGARLALLLVAGLGLGGCSWLPSVGALPGSDLFDSPRTLRGHRVDEEDLSQLVIGTATRADVEALLGSPSATGTFDDSDWFYIGGITRQRPGRQLAVEVQEVVRFRFDGQGRLAEIQRLGPQDGRDVQMVARITPSPGNERTLMQQIFGNIGRVGPGLGAQTATPGAPSPGSGR